MNPDEANLSKRFKVGLFALLGLLLIGAITVYVNDRPFWWRPCQLVHINIDDATGLKTKSPVRSLGLQIGYLKSVELYQNHVRLAMCITAPVEVLPETRAYIRGEGFLGDKFVELKPVRYLGEGAEGPKRSATDARKPSGGLKPAGLARWVPAQLRVLGLAAGLGGSEARAQQRSQREIPVGEASQDVQDLVNQVDQLVGEMTTLTDNLKKAFKPEELERTIKQLNQTLAHASRTLSPEGNLTTTAQRTLAKLEDAIEQLRDMTTRVNQGKGSVGMLLNDPVYAEELRRAAIKINDLISRVDRMRLVVDLGAAQLNAYDTARGWFQLEIWPQFDRYYLVGVTSDGRGDVKTTFTTTEVGGQVTTVRTTQVQRGGFVLTGMLGKVFWNRLDLSAGFLHGDGTISAKINAWGRGSEDHLQLISQGYVRADAETGDSHLNARLLLRAKPYSSVYVQGGLESIRKVSGQVPWQVGAGITFDDQDIKVLFSFL